jgi:hypothetical protein
MGDIKMHTKFWLENHKRRDQSEDRGIDGKIILESILEKEGGKMWTGFIWLRIGTIGRLL